MLGDLGKIIVAKGFKKLPKVQKIAKSGHTAGNAEQSCRCRVDNRARKLVDATTSNAITPEPFFIFRVEDFRANLKLPFVKTVFS